MSEVDCHIHSNISSDGEFSPGEIIVKCKAEGIKLAAVTDHNSVRAVPEALSAAEEEGIRVLSGVELDCTYSGRNFHLLGYHEDEISFPFMIPE